MQRELSRAASRAVARMLTPEQWPSLDLDFLGGQLDPRISFTRASTATYTGADGVVRAAAINEPRFEAGGLLIEEARTNLLTRAETFDNATWAKNATTVIANAAVAPDGALTADEVRETVVVGGFYSVFQAASVTTGTAYTASIYVRRAAGTRNLRIVFGTGGFGAGVQVNFDLAAVTATGGGGATGTIQSVGGGWFRVSTAATATATLASGITYAILSGTAGTYDGDGTSGLYLWGAQLEAGAFPTSYIPTVASTVTRALETAVIPTDTWFNAAAGTLVAQGTIPVSGGPNVFTLASLTNNSSAHRMLMGVSAATTSTVFRVSTAGAGANPTDQAISGVASGVKLAMAYAPGDVAATANGLIPTTSAPATLPTITQLAIGGQAATGGWLPPNGHIRRVRYWPARKPNDFLQGVTA